MINNELLRSRRFLPFFVTQFLGAFNDSVLKNAIVMLITYKAIHGSLTREQFFVTLSSGIFILPFFTFSALAGQLADKFERALLIRIIKFFEIAVALIAACGFYLNSIVILIFSLFLMGVHSTFFSAIKYAILPDHLREEELIAGNAYVEASTFIAILTGTLLGGVLILFSGIGGVIATSAVLLLVAIGGWLVSFLIPSTLPAQPELKINFRIWSETMHIIDYSTRERDVFLCILGISWFWLLGGMLLSQFPTLVKNILMADAHVATLFSIVFSLGVAAGSLGCARVLKKEVTPKYVPLGLLGTTVFLVDFYFACRGVSPPMTGALVGIFKFLLSPNNWRILIDLLLLSFCGGLYIVPLYAILQTKANPQHRSRTIASNNIINSLFMVAAVLVTLILLMLQFSLLQILMVIAIANAVVAVYICKLLPHILLQSFARWLLRLLYRVKITGMEHYQAAGSRVIIVANHTSFLDVALLSAFLPDKFIFAVNARIAKEWWMQPFLLLVDTFLIEPSNPLSIKSLIKEVKQDKKCVIFPEGRLTMTGALMKIYEGTGLVADRTGATVLPIRIQGAQATPFSRLRGKVKMRLFPKITMTILPPCHFDVPEAVQGSKRRTVVSKALYEIMTTMMFTSSDYKKCLFDALLEARKIYGRRHVVLEDVDRIPLTYQQWIMRSFLIGNHVRTHTYKNENVGILLPNMVSTLIVFFGLQLTGRVPAMLNFSSGKKAVGQACQLADIKQVYTSKRFVEAADLFSVVHQLTQQGVNVIYLEDMRNQITVMDKMVALWMSVFGNYYVEKINPSRSSKDPAVILFTSGSEGTPKGVALSHENILANHAQFGAVIDFNVRDVVVNALPLFHSFGLNLATLLPLFSGIKVFLYPSPLHYRIVPEIIYDINATIAFGTDTFLAGYARYAHPYDFYNIRHVFAGAEKLKEETRRAWSEKFGIRLLEGYGTTETSPGLAVNTPMQNKTGTVGRFLPGIQYRLESVPGMEVGERLWVSGPNVMLGYLQADHPGEIKSVIDGWYDTGDIVTIDEQGFITILDRAKRFAKVGGEMISLTGVERCIAEKWPGSRHAVLSIEDPKKGEQLVLITESKEMTREGVLSFMQASGMSPLSVPRTVWQVSAMPLLGSGKIDYVTLKQQLKNNAEKWLHPGPEKEEDTE